MTPILLTLTLIALSNSIAVPLGVAWGWALDAFEKAASSESRLVVRVHGFLSQVLLACLVGMLSIPIYIHAAGWEGAAGKFGWLPTLQGGPRYWFTGIWAAAWIHGTYGSCWIAIATWWAIRRQPRLFDQCARLDTDPVTRKWLIDLPFASSWIIAAVAWNSVLVATEMTVADLYGVTTLADIVYKVYALDPQPIPVLAATLLPAMFVVPVILWLFGRTRWLAWTLRGGDIYDAGSEQESRGQVVRRVLAGIAALSITALVGMVPLISLIAKAGWTVHETNQQVTGLPGLSHSFAFSQVSDTLRTSAGSFQAEFFWTTQLAFTTMLFALPVCLLLAAWTESRPQYRALVVWMMLLVAMIPGPVISLFVIQAFNRPALSLLYDRSLIPSVIAVLPRAIPFGYLIVRAGYRMLDLAVLDCAKLDGMGTARRLLFVDGPRLWRPITLAGLCILLVACADLSATLLVLPPSVSTVAARLFGLLHSGVRHQEAGLALLALFYIGLISVPVIRLVR